METPLQLTVGQAVVTVMNVGDIPFDLTMDLTLDKALWEERYAATMSARVQMPVQCIVIRTPQVSVLVDAALYVPEPNPEHQIADYTSPPALLDQLAAAGVDADAIEHIVVTHAHWDHFNGLTISAEGGGNVPAFPNAQVYLGRADWENPEMQHALEAPGSLQAGTLGVYARMGKLTVVDAAQEIAPGVEIIPTPGETPGHVMLRVASDGEILYCIGDLYHHVLEVEHATWATTWADPDAIRASRARMVAAAAAEDALLVATHLRGAGRLARTADGVRWREV